MRVPRENLDASRREVGASAGTTRSPNYPALRWVALDRRVLLVAAKDKNGAWDLYVGAVEGKDYNREASGVAENGSGVAIRVADVYFPDLTRNLMTKWDNGRGHFLDVEDLVASIERHQEVLKRAGAYPVVAPNIFGINPIDKHVFLVGVEVAPDGWVVYVGAVEGKDFEKEALGVLENGSEIPFELAEIFFEDEARTPELRYHPKSTYG